MVGVVAEPDLDLDEVVLGGGVAGGERLRLRLRGGGSGGGISAVGRGVGISEGGCCCFAQPPLLLLLLLHRGRIGEWGGRDAVEEEEESAAPCRPSSVCRSNLTTWLGWAGPDVGLGLGLSLSLRNK